MTLHGFAELGIVLHPAFERRKGLGISYKSTMGAAAAHERLLTLAPLVFLLLLVASCGGGSSGGSGSMSPSNLSQTLTYARSTTLTVGAAASLSPQISGPAAITSWSVNPSLPAGLSLSSTSGVIQGTP